MKKGLLLLRVSLMVLLPILAAGCLNPKIKLFTDETDPLQEFTLEGAGAEKVLVIPVEGFLSDQSRGGVLRRHPGAVQALVSQIRKAEKDKKIRAVVLKVNSPGGTVTASDILHHELMRYKTENGVTIVAVMMDVAASGGYYIALPADHIVAHPTSLTGSVGVIFAAPRLSGLMDKVGVDVHVVKSGRNKDMGSPFRETTPEENALFQDIIGELAGRFYDRVLESRTLSAESMAEVRTARIFTADQALQLGLVDEVGYLSDALEAARRAAGIAPDSRVVIYRRTAYPDDTVYNIHSGSSGRTPALVDTGLSDWLPRLDAGFYYLWPAALPAE
ncbi:MAG: signal peptide peptidase SppA [Desulfobacteraceae bacterium]|jgi:protease-4|nr:signal peptide peptidase SppA [Desulfobacteraceae bacterium]